MSTPEVVKFTDPSLRRKHLAQEWAKSRAERLGNAKNNKKGNDKTEDDEGFDVEQARFEVLKFGIDNDTQRERRLNAKQQLLIQLGAKAPKNEYTNYKKLKEQKEKQKEKQELPFHSMVGQKPTVKAQLSKRKGKSQKQIDVTSGYGKLRHGELVVGADTRRTFKKIQEKTKRLQERTAGRRPPPK